MEHTPSTDLAVYESDEPSLVIANWIRNRMSVEYLGLWEKLYNPNFNSIEFEGIKQKAGLHSFTLSPKKWVDRTNAIGIITKSGRYGNTYAHQHIAFKFGSWMSAEFELYLIKEFQRLKQEENKQLEAALWCCLFCLNRLFCGSFFKCSCDVII